MGPSTRAKKGQPFGPYINEGERIGAMVGRAVVGGKGSMRCKCWVGYAQYVEASSTEILHAIPYPYQWPMLYPNQTHTHTNARNRSRATWDLFQRKTPSLHLIWPKIRVCHGFT